MKNSDILGMCLRNLFKRKLRTILTMLGVVIGTIAIVVTISLGLAVDARFDQMINEMGDITVITVEAPGRFWFQGMEDMEIRELDADAARAFEGIPGVIGVLPIVENHELVFRSGNYAIQWGSVMGVRPRAMAALGYSVTEGRLLQEGNNLEAVFGSNAEFRFENMTTRDWSDRAWRHMMGEEVEVYVDIFNDRIMMSADRSLIFGDENLGEDIAFGDTTPPRTSRPLVLEVVGQLEHRDDWNFDNAIFMDIELIQRLRIEAQRQQQQDGIRWLEVDDGGWGHINANANVIPEIGYDRIFVRAADINLVSQIHEEITDLGFMAFYPGAWLSSMRAMMATNQQMLMAIGAVSLFVAAIAIANTMVMSTYERTREIGVMKVIGASLLDIKRLFLLEAAMIGFFGGVFGVLFSYLVSYILNNHIQMAFMGGMMDWMMGDMEDTAVSLITPWLSGIALIFTAVIGLVSGYFPARRATRLSALNAIRTE